MARHRPDAMDEMGRLFHSMEAALADDQVQLALDLVARLTEVARDKYRTEDVAVLLKTELAPLLSRAAQALSERQRHNEALLLLNRVVEIEQQCGDWDAVASARSDIATNYFQLHQFEVAIRILQEEVLPVRRRMRDSPGEAKCRRNISLAYAQLGDGSAAARELLASTNCAVAAGASELVILGLRTAVAMSQGGIKLPVEAIGQFRSIAASSGIPGLAHVSGLLR